MIFGIRCDTAVIPAADRILDRVVNFPAVHRHFARRFDAQANFVATDFYDDDLNVVVNNDTFVFLS